MKITHVAFTPSDIARETRGLSVEASHIRRDAGNHAVEPLLARIESFSQFLDHYARLHGVPLRELRLWVSALHNEVSRYRTPEASGRLVQT
jgi:hypothetical protein